MTTHTAFGTIHTTRVTSSPTSGADPRKQKRESMGYRFENTVGGQLGAKLREEMSEVLEVPNSWLPESYHDATGHRSLASVEQEYNRRHTETTSDHQKEKAAKAELIEIYAAKAERGEELFAA